MTEQQKNMTLGQVAEMKKNLENNIKNQITDFMRQTGCFVYLGIGGTMRTVIEISDDNTVLTRIEGDVKIDTQMK